jgi:beta-lactam-binding protein with PASTA domain
MNVDEARRRIRSIDLYESVLYQPSTDYTAGTVLSQSPSPGSKAKHRSQVTLMVASTVTPPQPQEPKMPNVVGMQYLKAKSLLEQLGLQVDYLCIVSSQYPGKPSGTVVGQSVQPGSLIGNKPNVVLTVVAESCVQ